MCANKMEIRIIVKVVVKGKEKRRQKRMKMKKRVIMKLDECMTNKEGKTEGEER